MRPPREDTVAWYKQFWPWFLISLPLSVVIASIVTINIAIRTDDGLVSDDYYKEGLAIHKDADSSARAKALGIAGELRYDAETGAVNIVLDTNPPETAGGLVLTVTHPTRPAQDQVIQLTPLNDLAYTGRIEPMGPANWKLELQPADKSWRVDGRLSLPDNPVVRIN